MSFRYLLLLVLLGLNLFACVPMWRGLGVWVRRRSVRRWLRTGMVVAVVLLNLPLLVFFQRGADSLLAGVPPSILKPAFLPTAAWIVTLLGFFIIAAPVVLISAVLRGVRVVLASGERPARALSHLESAEPVGLSRRQFLTGGAGLAVPALFGAVAYDSYSGITDLEISPEQAIPIPGLPRALDGMTIVQLTDLHVGPYIQEGELRHLVGIVNGLRPDLVVLTGDVIDRHLSQLPAAVKGLTGLKSTLGCFAVLGNHDISSDRYSYDRQFRGGVQIADGLNSAGIRTLRNESVYLGSGADRIALLGLDWLTANRTGRSFFRYDQAGTRRVLQQISQQIEPGVPRILLAHHPDTFDDVHPFAIALTLAGHTHGGGQIVLAHWNGQPVGIASLRFKYQSGLYQANGSSLYVYRGIGYLGVPIRINCPPEISRFKLVRPSMAS
jgi:predicted MPP superfamily phosphohydrolase